MINYLKSAWHYVKAIRNNKGFFRAYHDKGNLLSLDLNKSQINYCKFTITGKNNRIIIEDGCILTGVWFFLGGDNNTIHVGANTYSNSDERRMNLFSVAHGTTLQIGSKCLFASDIEIQTTDHHKIIVGGKQTNRSKDVVIGNHCWVAAHSSILKGVQIANNTVVGANSVVVKDVMEENCVIAGNPAKVVKSNIEWDY